MCRIMAHLQYAISVAGDIKRTKEGYREPCSHIRYGATGLPVRKHRTASDVKKKTISSNSLLAAFFFSYRPFRHADWCLPFVAYRWLRIGIGYACHGSQVELAARRRSLRCTIQVPAKWCSSRKSRRATQRTSLIQVVRIATGRTLDANQTEKSPRRR